MEKVGTSNLMWIPVKDKLRKKEKERIIIINMVIIQLHCFYFWVFIKLDS